MNSPLSTLADHHTEKLVVKKQALAAKMFNSLIQADRYVGEVFSVGYNEFIAQVHDSFRRDVGGIPQGAFLIATRVSPSLSALPFDAEDSEIVLLRVMGPTTLPRDGERQDQRADAVARAMQGDSAWESEVDEYTHNNLSFSGLRCRVLGTIYIEENADVPDGLQLRLGTDIDNFYSGRGMKIYKPSDDALKQLVNYRDPEFRSDHPLGDHTVPIASLRYGSTRRNLSSDGVDISITPADLIGQKTALFGMTRSGKSNTTKIIAQAIYELRTKPVPTDGTDTPEQAAVRAKSNRIGQLIFDPNGEYANENVQDGTNLNPSALKNIHQHLGLPKAAEVVTYGTLPHPKDPDRRLMKINVFGDQLAMTDMLGIKTAAKSGVASDVQKAQEDAYTVLQEKTQMLLIGKAILNELLAPSKETKYIGNFIGTDLAPPDLTMFPPAEAYGRGIRYIRSLLVYRALLAEGGLDAPFKPSAKNLFSKELREAMCTPLDPKEATLQQEFEEAAAILDPKQTPSPSWNDLAIAFKTLDKFLERPEYAEFNKEYRKTHEGRSWHDSTLQNILGMFRYSNGPRLAGRLYPNHAPASSKDYADMIYDDLLDGKLVILDQSLGEELANRAVAERVMWKLLRSHMGIFGQGNPPPAVLVYVEEAHNLLPKKSAEGEVNVWARLAKEGAKLNLGLVYATQEVSALQSNILKNTANWFIAHLNNSEEIREISKYYDFEDFADSIQRAPNKGFIRMRTRTNVFTIPVQIRKFDLATSSAPGAGAAVAEGN